MITIDDSLFTDQDRLLVETVVRHAKREVRLSAVLHVIHYGTLPPIRIPTTEHHG